MGGTARLRMIEKEPASRREMLDRLSTARVSPRIDQTNLRAPVDVTCAT